jgi:hypothetical protein
VNSIQKPSRSRQCDGREYAQNAKCDGELYDGERVSHRTFRKMAGFDSILLIRDTPTSRIIRMYSFRPPEK